MSVLVLILFVFHSYLSLSVHCRAAVKVYAEYEQKKAILAEIEEKKV